MTNILKFAKFEKRSRFAMFITILGGLAVYIVLIKLLNHWLPEERKVFDDAYERSEVLMRDPEHYLGYFERVDDLLEIVIALNEYDQVNYAVPKSSDVKQGWDGLYTGHGKSGKNWVPELVPKYISELPRDPRNNNHPDVQYVYRSDGVDYKILARRVDDCEKVKGRFPELIDPKRDCWAYGFWTEGAAHW